jgi:glucosamine-6-phosphate deaminase
MKEFSYGKLKVLAADSTAQMAARAAADFAASARSLLQTRREINVVFSGAESQTKFHAALRERRDVEWGRINAFSVDEFYAPGMAAENAVSAQPTRDLYKHVPLKSVNVINYAAKDIEGERRRYEKLINAHPPHISCLGIGISGHIALNEPGETDFEDSRRVRYVVVPYAIKAAVVAKLMKTPLSPELPASILGSKVGATLYLDPESAREIVTV